MIRATKCICGMFISRISWYVEDYLYLGLLCSLFLFLKLSTCHLIFKTSWHKVFFSFARYPTFTCEKTTSWHSFCRNVKKYYIYPTFEQHLDYIFKTILIYLNVTANSVRGHTLWNHNYASLKKITKEYLKEHISCMYISR